MADIGNIKGIERIPTKAAGCATIAFKVGKCDVPTCGRKRLLLVVVDNGLGICEPCLTMRFRDQEIGRL